MITRRVKAIRKCRTHFNNVSSFVICTSSFGPSITFLFHPTQKSPVRHVRILAPLEHTHRHEIFRHAGRAASLESAFDRCFGTVVKNQRHPVAGGNFNQSARLFRSLELLRATNNSVQRVEQRALLINHQLGVTDDVDEQDMPDLELNFRGRLGRIGFGFIASIRLSVKRLWPRVDRLCTRCPA